VLGQIPLIGPLLQAPLNLAGNLTRGATDFAGNLFDGAGMHHPMQYLSFQAVSDPRMSRLQGALQGW
jgi:hypothetical protein